MAALAVAPVLMRGRRRLRHVGSLRRALVWRHGELVPLPPPEVLGSKGQKQRLTAEGELEVHVLSNLFEPSELLELVALSEKRQGFQPSYQITESGNFVLDQRRTSSSCPMLWPLLCPSEKIEELRSRGQEAAAEAIEKELEAVRRISGRCAEAVGVDAGRIEPLQLVRYTPGQFYSPHMDTHQEPDRLSSYSGEQRTHTLLVFVTDVPENDGGGHTNFPRLGLKVLPKAGDALLWRNVLSGDGCIPDPHALHEGVAPTSCEKIAMNVWIADRPFTMEGILNWRQRQAAAAKAALATPATAPASSQGSGQTDFLD